MSYKDTQQFKKARVSLKMYSSGRPVPFWLSDPKNPAVKRTPGGIYARGVNAGSAFRRNFGAIFILPKKVLKPGRWYAVEADLWIGSRVYKRKWSFRTRGPMIWRVLPPGQAGLLQSFKFVLQKAAAVDRLRLAAGVYPLERIPVIRKNLTILGSGAQKTIFECSEPLRAVFTILRAQVLLERVGYRGLCRFMQVVKGDVRLHQVRLHGRNKKSYLMSVFGGSSLRLENTTIKMHVSLPRRWPVIYVQKGNNTRLIVGRNNRILMKIGGKWKGNQPWKELVHHFDSVRFVGEQKQKN